jgi:hypothetical protein
MDEVTQILIWVAGGSIAFIYLYYLCDIIKTIKKIDEK